MCVNRSGSGRRAVWRCLPGGRADFMVIDPEGNSILVDPHV